MRAPRASVWLCLAALVVLTGCANVKKSLLGGMGGSSPQKPAVTSEEASSEEPGVSAGSGEKAAVSSSAQVKVSTDFKPEVIDILTVFQTALTDEPDGFDSENLVNAPGIIGQVLLVTKGMKLHRSVEQHRLFYVISGRGEIVLAGEPSSVRAGHVIAVPVGATFQIAPSGEQPLRLMAFKSPGRNRNAVEWLKEKEEEPVPVEEPEVERMDPGEETASEPAEEPSSAPAL